MRIIYMTHYFPPEGNAPATRVHAMCKRWAERGHDVHVVTCAPNVPTGKVYEGYRNTWHQQQVIDGISVSRVWTFLAPNKGLVLRVANYLSYVPTAVWRVFFLRRADVIIATSPQFFCGWAGVIAAFLTRTKFILEIRDIWPESIQAVGAFDAKSSFISKSVFAILHWFEKRMYKMSDKIVTVGDGYRQKLIERGVPAEKIITIPNGVDLNLFQPKHINAAKRTEANAGPDDFLVGYVGTVGMAHGLDVVMRAARLAKRNGLEKIKFVLIGDGAMLDQLKKELTHDDVQLVRLLGRKPKNEIPEWLGAIDACLIHLKDRPLFSTVIPSKMFEAAAMEKPILLGVRGQAEQILQAGKCGVCFAPEDEQGLLDAVCALQSLPDKGRSLGQSGRKYVGLKFDYEILAKTYEDLVVRMNESNA